MKMNEDCIRDDITENIIATINKVKMFIISSFFGFI